MISQRELARQRDAVIQRLQVEGQENLVVLNALLWKFKVKNLQEALDIVGEYMAWKKDELDQKAKDAAAGVTRIDNFIPLNHNDSTDTNPADQASAANPASPGQPETLG